MLFVDMLNFNKVSSDDVKFVCLIGIYSRGGYNKVVGRSFKRTLQLPFHAVMLLLYQASLFVYTGVHS
jgi:hypothetical protein